MAKGKPSSSKVMLSHTRTCKSTGQGWKNAMMKCTDRWKLTGSHPVNMWTWAAAVHQMQEKSHAWEDHNKVLARRSNKIIIHKAFVTAVSTIISICDTFFSPVIVSFPVPKIRNHVSFYPLLIWQPLTNDWTRILIPKLFVKWLNQCNMLPQWSVFNVLWSGKRCHMLRQLS